MAFITTQREIDVRAPWAAYRRRLGDVLTAEAWSRERAHIVSRTHVRFVIAIRSVDAARDSVRFSLIADSPDLRHPVTGYVEVRPSSDDSTMLSVSLVADLDEGVTRFHQNAREAIASLADVLTSTVAAAANAE